MTIDNKERIECSNCGYIREANITVQRSKLEVFGSVWGNKPLDKPVFIRRD